MAGDTATQPGVPAVIPAWQGVVGNGDRRRAMAFIQVIEFTTTKPDEVRALSDEYRASTEDRRTVVHARLCRDRDQPDRYVNIVEFESYEAAMENSNLPETHEFARRMAELCDGPPRFLNLDVSDSFDG
jgi:quinol monooxygenase YgiN